MLFHRRQNAKIALKPYSVVVADIILNCFRDIVQAPVESLTDSIVQKAKNAEARSHSGKTIANDWTLFRSAIEEAGGKRFEPALPPVVKNQHEFLTAEQIPVFTDAIHGTDVELAALLGLHSLRRSEIIDLTWSDIDLRCGLIHVSGSAVLDEHGNVVHKIANKTSNSSRYVPIMIPRLRELLETVPHDSEYLVPYWPHLIYKRINAICSRASLPQIGPHGLRHSFASLAVHCGMAPDIAMRIGGWDDIGTMKKIYTHVSEADIAKAASGMSAFYATKP